MANTQINITENGTKTLATAGKYCDRNIDVNVNVPAKPTQFTNVLDLPTTIVKEGYRVTSMGYNETNDGVAIIIPCSKGSHRIRMRGKWVTGYLNVSTSANGAIWYSNFYEASETPTDTTFRGSIINVVAEPDFRDDTAFGIDEYGDCYIDFTTKKDGYIGFTLKDLSVNYHNSTFSAPIITIDEPIGNGGVV